MPRKAKRTMGGMPAQSSSPVPGQMYGAGVEQSRLAQQMPTPAARRATSQLPSTPQGRPAPQPAPPPGAPAPQPATVSGEPSPEDRYQRALTAAQQMQGQFGMLTRPSDRPDEPITAGLAVGPGPGPEMLGSTRRNPTAETFQRLSQLTGDSYLAELAQRAGF